MKDLIKKIIDVVDENVNHQYSVRWVECKILSLNRFKIHIKWKAKNILKR